MTTEPTTPREVMQMAEGREVLTAMDVVLRLEKKVDLVLADHEERIREVERENAATRLVASALVEQDRYVTETQTVKFDKRQKTIIGTIAASQLLLTVMTLGPDLFRYGG
jgi:hypothetical protein